MSQIVAPPPAREQTRTRRRGLPWLSSEPEKRSIQIGILGTVLIHLILLMLAPYFLSAGKAGKGLAPKEPPVTIQIDPNSFLPPKPPPPKPPPMKYVEANPLAPENVPDKTNNFSDRNQQVAQEKPAEKVKGDMPTLKGRTDIDSNQIVTGQLHKPQDTVPVTAPPPSTVKPPSAAAPRREENPLPGLEKQQGDSKDGFASNVAKTSDNPKQIPQKIDGAKDAPLVDSATATTPQIDPKHPQPRRVLDQNVRPAIFKQNDFGTSNIGPTGLDAKWSNYGVYLKKLTETVQLEWDAILEDSRIYPNPGSTVSITFVLNSKGDISSIKKVESSSGTSDAAQHACATALTARAPYGDWTDDMIAMLGTEQTMTFTFYYQ